MKRIKIYGERNSGTHFLEYLVSVFTRNQVVEQEFSKFDLLLLKSIKYDVVEDFVFSKKKKRTYGWKHGLPPVKMIQSSNPEELPIFITITKNPYSFLVSLFSKPYHYKGEVPETFSEFIRSKWVCRRRDGISPRTLGNPVLLWNIKNDAFLRLADLKRVQVVNVKYEDLLRNPLLLKEKLTEIAGVELTEVVKVNPEMVVKRGEKEYDFYRDYYLNEKWKENLSIEDLQHINKYLDKNLVSELGYELLE